MPKISVIIPVYNAEKYLRKCLDSLVKQQFKDFEVLMVDDGSTDSSMSICQDYVQKDDRFKFFYQDHQGQSVARNYALTVARGGRLTFVDSDDYVNDDYLSSLNEQMDKYDSDIATAPYFRYNLQTHQFGILAYGDLNADDYDGVYNSTDWLLKHDLWKEILSVGYDALWGKLYQRNAFQHLWLPADKQYGEDVLISWKIYRNVDKISFENKAEYCWQVHLGELSTDSDSTKYIPKSTLRAIEEEIATLAIAGEDVSSLKNEYHHCVKMAMEQAMAHGDFYGYHDAKFKLEHFEKGNN